MSTRGRVLDDTEPVRRRCRHPVARSAELSDQLLRIQPLGDPWALFRAGGRPRAFADRCPHRGAPLPGRRSFERAEEAPWQ